MDVLGMPLAIILLHTIPTTF